MAKSSESKQTQKPREPVYCSNCDKRVAQDILDHCKCSIWDVGKQKHIEKA